MKKKIASVVLCIPLAFGMVACSVGQDSSSTETAETSINTPTPTAAEKPIKTQTPTPTATPTPSSTPTPTATPTPDPVPVVTYDDIATGNYNGQTIQIDAIIDKVSLASYGSLDFSLWYPSNGTYVYDGQGWMSDIEAGSPQEVFANAQNGDVIRFETTVYGDGSFGAVEITAAQIVGNQNIDDVRNAFKSSCPDMNYEDVSRNPDSYKDMPMKISGTVFQIISESDYSAEYLIETSAGYVYASWYDGSDVRGSRFLEDDSVTVYGTFEMLKTYNTLAGDNTVPQLSVVFMDLS